MKVTILSISSAGLALLLHGNPVFALDRLLTTPAERSRLDAIRFRTGGSSVDDPAPVSDKITVDGIILGRGRNRVWVNGTNLNAKHRSEGYQPEYQRVRYNRVPLKLSGRQADIQLRPGETYILADGSKRDAFQLRSAPDRQKSGQADTGKADILDNQNFPLTDSP